MRINRRSLVIGGAALGAVGLSPAFADAVAADRAAIESNLLTAVSLTNRPPERLTIADRMARYNVPGASVAVLRNGKLAWSGAYGVRRAGGAPVTSETLFQAASLSKPVTAFGALLLHERRAIKLDDDVNRLLRDWKIPFAQNVPREPIMLFQLLSHSAGVNVPSFPGFAPTDQLPSLQAILDGAPEAKTPRVQVANPPGPPRYSGGGYMIVEKLIEDLTSERFDEYMQQYVLGPLGLNRSTFAPVPPARLAANIASGHGWKGALRNHDWLAYPQHAAASLWSTAEDLVRFLGAVMACYRGTRGALLKRDNLIDVRFMESIDHDASSRGVAELLAHAGWNTGYRCYMAAFPKTGDGIAVMTNADHGHDLAMEIVRSAARVYGWPAFQQVPVQAVTLSDETFAAITGTYDFPEAEIQLVVSRDQDRLKVSAPRGFSTLQPVAHNWPQSITLYGIEDAEAAMIQRKNGALEFLLWGMTGRRVGG